VYALLENQHTERLHARDPQLSACGKSPAPPTQEDIFMTATNNLQTTAGMASAAYRNITNQLGHLGLDTAVPEGVRVLADKAVAQTREAYSHSKDAFDASLTTFEKSFDAAGQGAAAFNRKIVDIARRNVDTSFDLATSLAGAKNLVDIVELQTDFWRKQFGVLTSQAAEVRALAAKVTADVAEPIKLQMARSDGQSR
jgi:phasin